MDDKKIIWAFGGGKGGIGKSLIAANLAIGLARMGRDVILVDGDFGNANLHSYLGLSRITKTLYDFFNKDDGHLEDFAVNTPIKNLRLIGGANEVYGAANPEFKSKLKLLAYIRELQTQLVILDLGAGVSFDGLDLFALADVGFVIILPNQPSFENANGFIRSVVLRKLIIHFEKFPGIYKILEEAVFPGSDFQVIPIPEILKRISDTDSKKGKEAAHIASDVDIRVIMNFVHEEKEIEEAKRFRQMVKNSSGVETRFLGHIYFDNTVRQSLAKLTPQILDSRRSPATICLYDILIKILGYEDTVWGSSVKRDMDEVKKLLFGE